MSIKLINLKLESMQTLLSSAIELCEKEAVKSGNGWYLMEAQTLKVLGSMIQMEHEAIDRHERIMLTKGDSKASAAILKEAGEKFEAGFDIIDNRIKEALKGLGVEIEIKRIDDTKDKLQ